MLHMIPIARQKRNRSQLPKEEQAENYFATQKIPEGATSLGEGLDETAWVKNVRRKR